MAVRGVTRGLVVAAMSAGALVPAALVSAPAALADPCPNGTARVFLGDATNSCQGAGSVTYDAVPVSKVCSMSGTNVTIQFTATSKKYNRDVEIYDGRCATFDLRIQKSISVTVAPS
ncbi:hypothetical protein ACWEVD_08540 [Nocardia thailandica]|uniref:Uncharacterized protein n=1 Tax=Nocardia thailandica TaxID=257275 RepID=A0ABW6PUD4_9NOCA|nr:hypothetical protein [Nocardia thailandica]